MGVLVTTPAKGPPAESYSLLNPVSSTPSPLVPVARGIVPSMEPTAHFL